MANQDDDKVGKNRPPKTPQWKKGQSGNPGGRPPGSKNRHTTIRNILNEVVNAEIGGERKTISVDEASVRKLAQMALKGDRSSILHILALWKETDDAMQAAVEAQYPYSEADRQVIEDIYARMKACEEPSDT